MTFNNNNQYVLNSGIMDNRTMIGYMDEGEEWVLDYKIVNSSNQGANGSFEFSLGEYVYSTDENIYRARNGFMSFETRPADGNKGELEGKPDDCYRKIIKVVKNDYDKDTFTKDSKVYLKIKPSSAGDYFIEKIALYRKSLDKNNKIIIPDYENEESLSAEEYVDSGTMAHKYHYFSNWLIDSNNPEAITEKDKLPTIVKNSLDYIDYLPVYNNEAEKIRTVSAKESNYFNILQNIA